MPAEHATVLVVGAGMTGIGAGYWLGRAGLDYLLLEADDAIGGVWHTHRWPGVRCDSDFIKYSFSFAPYLSERCLQDGERIRDYLVEVAERFGVTPRIRFGARVRRATFDPARGLWRVDTDHGAFLAPFLLNGNGYYSQTPHRPHFPGEEEFAGELVHAMHLDAARSFAGRDVVLVGSGATAVCCAPVIARRARSLVMVQRSPGYIFETDDRAGPLVRACQQLYRRGVHAPVAWLRRWLQLRDDLIFVGFRRFPRLARRFFERHWRDEVGEACYRRHFRPRYDPWQQRIAVAIGFKQALRDGRLRLRTARIERFGATGPVLDSGETLACDLCVLATGMDLEFFKFEILVGNRPAALDGVNFHKGLMLGGVPNYFHPMGSWHSAWTQRMEPVTRLAIRIMRHVREHGLRTVSVERRELPAAPGITPNYVLRALATMPRLEGTTDLPTLDNLFAARFDPRDYRFA